VNEESHVNLQMLEGADAVRGILFNHKKATPEDSTITAKKSDESLGKRSKVVRKQFGKKVNYGAKYENFR
jgi:hypothetical protein